MGTLDLKNPEFWDLAAVDKELRRVYDICGGCRRCLPLCPSFKVLFDRMDVEAVDGDVDKLPAADVKEVVWISSSMKKSASRAGGRSSS